MHKGIGEIPKYDGRDAGYLMSEVLEEELSGASLPAEKFWKIGPILDQGSEGACVGFAWAGWLNCDPVTPTKDLGDKGGLKIYHRCQEIDDFPAGTSGTSTRAGADVMRERDRLSKYVHATTYEQLAAWIKAFGPVVLSCRWDQASYETDGRGFLRHGGSVVGGHAFLCYGVSKWGTLRCQNSWGEDAMDAGSFWIAKEEWLYRMRMGYFSAITAAELARKN